jgi:hypothetical protein
MIFSESRFPSPIRSVQAFRDHALSTGVTRRRSDKNGNVTKVPYREHVPPDVTACIFCLNNRKPADWRDVQNVEHVLGRYIISDRPMTEDEWVAARATVIDVTPEK